MFCLCHYKNKFDLCTFKLITINVSLLHRCNIYLNRILHGTWVKHHCFLFHFDIHCTLIRNGPSEFSVSVESQDETVSSVVGPVIVSIVFNLYIFRFRTCCCSRSSCSCPFRSLFDSASETGQREIVSMGFPQTTPNDSINVVNTSHCYQSSSDRPKQTLTLNLFGLVRLC